MFIDRFEGLLETQMINYALITRWKNVNKGSGYAQEQPFADY